MRVLVTGAGGFIGRAVVTRLGKGGFDVTALVHSDRTPIPGAARTLVGDITDKAFLEEALGGMDTVVHLAARKLDEPDSRAVNVGGMQNLIEAAKKTSTRILAISSASVKLAQPGLYGATKKEAEDLLVASGKNSLILRPSIVYGDDRYGAFATLVRAAQLPLIPMFGDGTWVSHPIYIDDLAEAIKRALERALPAQIYDVGGPEAVSLDTVLKSVRTILLQKPPPRIMHVSRRIGNALATVLALCMRKPPITKSNVAGSNQPISWEGSAFFKDFDFMPRTLAEGLHAMVERKRIEEARVLYTYIYSRSGTRSKPAPALLERYVRATLRSDLPILHPLLLSFPILIGPLDAATRLSSPESGLRKRLLIMSALVEADPRSVSWLYPRERQYLSVIAEAALLGISALVKILAGAIFALLPGFLKIYAR